MPGVKQSVTFLFEKQEICSCCASYDNVLFTTLAQVKTVSAQIINLIEFSTYI